MERRRTSRRFFLGAPEREKRGESRIVEREARGGEAGE